MAPAATARIPPGGGQWTTGTCVGARRRCPPSRRSSRAWGVSPRLDRAQHGNARITHCRGLKDRPGIRSVVLRWAGRRMSGSGPRYGASPTSWCSIVPPISPIGVWPVLQVHSPGGERRAAIVCTVGAAARYLAYRTRGKGQLVPAWVLIRPSRRRERLEPHRASAGHRRCR
jgi:hypothetical protein